MKTNNTLCGISIAVALQLGMLVGSAQTNKYLYTGSETNITLSPGTYIITAYGAQGGGGSIYGGGLGADMEGQFIFSTNTTLTLLVGGGGGDYYTGSFGGGGGGGSFVVNVSTPLVVAGGGGGAGSGSSYGDPGLTGTTGGNGQTSYTPDVGGTSGNGGDGDHGLYGSGSGGGIYSGGTAGYGGGGGQSFISGGGGGAGFGGGTGGYGGGGGGCYFGGGGGGGYSGGSGAIGNGGGGASIIDSSAITNLAEVSGIASPDDSTGNGEIIITTFPIPPTISITTTSKLPVVFWPTNATGYVLQSITNLSSGSWSNVTSGITIVGTNYMFTNTQNLNAAFFRLMQ
jgi:hypothetical protein